MIRLRVHPPAGTGEPFDVEITSRDVLIWEKTTHGASYAKLIEARNMVDLYRLGHIAARRSGQYDGNLESFEAGCELEPLGDEEDATDPTPPGP